MAISISIWGEMIRTLVILRANIVRSLSSSFNIQRIGIIWVSMNYLELLAQTRMKANHWITQWWKNAPRRSSSGVRYVSLLRAMNMMRSSLKCSLANSRSKRNRNSNLRIHLKARWSEPLESIHFNRRCFRSKIPSRSLSRKVPNRQLRLMTLRAWIRIILQMQPSTKGRNLCR